VLKRLLPTPNTEALSTHDKKNRLVFDKQLCCKYKYTQCVKREDKNDVNKKCFFIYRNTQIKTNVFLFTERYKVSSSHISFYKHYKVG